MAIWLTEESDTYHHHVVLGVETINALGGDDSIYISGDAASVNGNDGNDAIYVSNMNSISAQGDKGQDYFVLYDNVQSGTLSGGAGDDLYHIRSVTGLGSVTLNGGGGDDTFSVTADNLGPLIVYGGTGYDVLNISGRNAALSEYWFRMNNGLEELFFNGDRDDFLPEASINVSGNSGDNKIFAAGSYGQEGNSANIKGLGGDDDITAYNFDDIIIRGGSGNDTLYASGESTSKLYGDDGNDYLAGNGVFWGGAGSDTFEIRFQVNQFVAKDFDGDSDRIQLRQFEGVLPAGELSEAAFCVGSQAQDADDRIIFDSATGKLFFDWNGSGAGGKQLLSTLNVVNGTVDYTDFFVYEPPVEPPPPGGARIPDHGDFFS